MTLKRTVDINRTDKRKVKACHVDVSMKVLGVTPRNLSLKSLKTLGHVAFCGIKIYSESPLHL